MKKKIKTNLGNLQLELVFLNILYKHIYNLGKFYAKKYISGNC